MCRNVPNYVSRFKYQEVDFFCDWYKSSTSIRLRDHFLFPTKSVDIIIIVLLFALYI